MKNNLLKISSFMIMLALGVFNQSLHAQSQVSNADFENWDNVGTDNERPDYWNNIMNGDVCGLCSFGQIQTVWQDTDTRPGSTGNYSAKIKTDKLSAFGQSIIVNGAMTLGKLHAPSTTPADGYNQTHRNDPQFSQVLNDTPDSLVVWVKYSITDNSDSARISAVIHDDYDLQDPQDNNSQSHVVAVAQTNFQTNGNWMRLSIPFDYVGPATSAEYIIVTFTSSYDAGNGVENASLWVDDLELIYNNSSTQNSVVITPTTTQNLYENQSGTLLEATELPTAANSREWRYSTASGGPYDNIITTSTGVNYLPNFATAGTYYVICQSDFEGNIVTSNEVEINVSVQPSNTVGIAPADTQNLLEGQPGTMILATENPTADSRQWMFSTTQGSGYNPFLPPLTSLAYTPVFGVAGTYYIICESNFGGTAVASNEVIVIVTKDTTSNLDNNVNTSFSIVTDNKDLRIDFSEINDNNAIIQLVNVEGKVIVQQNLTANQLNVIQTKANAGMYFYTISVNGEVYKGKLFIK